MGSKLVFVDLNDLQQHIGRHLPYIAEFGSFAGQSPHCDWN